MIPGIMSHKYLSSLLMGLLTLVLIVLPACTTMGPPPEIISTLPAASSTAAGSDSALAVEPGLEAQIVETPLPAAPQPQATEGEAAPVEAVSVNPGVNPLTGLAPERPDIMDRRPVIVKVQNLPRPRFQYGISFADLVFEYYTEAGSTRFAALYYGNYPEIVAPIRSARFMDMHLVRMYGANFIFGSAYDDLFTALVESDIEERLFIELPGSCPAICRYDPDGKNYLSASLDDLPAYMEKLEIDQGEFPNLQGMAFDGQSPANGQPAPQLFARFSGAIYNRWDYDAESGRYLRYADADDDLSFKNEVYEPLTDQLTGEQIAADNVVIVLAEYKTVGDPEVGEVWDVDLTDSGMAYVARNGQIYNVRWERAGVNSVLTFFQDDGTPFPLKPGKTWFEVMGIHTHIEMDGEAWRFTHWMP
jgi:hypothetical protein